MNNENISQIDVTKIAIRDDRLRTIDESALTALKNDIEVYGLTQAIEVRKLKGGRYELIDGGHRLAAVMQLGWPEVKAILRECSVKEARIRSALANLNRASLTMLDRALHIWRVKSVWMELHPNRGHGGYRKKGEYQFAVVATWTEAIPGKVGLSDRTLADCARIGEKITLEAAETIRGTGVDDNQSELLALIKYGPDIQQKIAQKISSGEAKTVIAAAALVTNLEPIEPAPMLVVKQVSRIWSSFEKISDEAKREFVLKLKGEGFI